jgi:hypothetical protein
MFAKYVALVIITCFATSSLACPKPVTFLRNGEGSPCDGYLFSPDKERELRLMNEDYKLVKEELVIKDRVITNYKTLAENAEFIASKEAEKAELWRNRTIDITNKFATEEEGRGRRDWLFLVSGVLLTVAAGWAVGAAK